MPSPDLVHSIETRLQKLTGSWDRRFVLKFSNYLHGKRKLGVSPIQSIGSQRTDPYWIRVPELVADSHLQKEVHSGVSRNFMKDTMWGQICLYYAVKIHDDLYDRHEDRLSFLWAGDEFFLEAYRVFSKHFGQNYRFWTFFQGDVLSTIRSVQKIQNQEIQTRPTPRNVESEYPQLYSVCKVALHALCIKLNLTRAFRRLSDFYDQMAIVGQMLDDFEDIVDDFNHGRINSVARFLLDAGGPARMKPLDRMAHNLLYTDVSTRLFLQLDRYLVKAQKSIECLKLPALEEYLVSYRDSVRRMGERVHAQRVRELFGKNVNKQTLRKV
jgi:hypothetical protein